MEDEKSFADQLMEYLREYEKEHALSFEITVFNDGTEILEQYELTRENIALINQKCHDLKHQIRALRNATKEELEHYLEEIEGQVQIYDAIVKTGNEVLDTILTEKSLYCKERGISVFCVADGSQMFRSLKIQNRGKLM